MKKKVGESFMKTSKERIAEAMRIRNISQSKLTRDTGISKGAISSYLSGRYEPKQDSIYKLAKALNVNEAWLMGYDVSMDRDVSVDELDEFEREMISIIGEISKERTKKRLLTYARKLKDIEDAERDAEKG